MEHSCLNGPAGNAVLMSFTFLHLSLNHGGRWGTTDDFTTSFPNFLLFSTALWDLANSRPVHSLMLSSHLFFCLLCLLFPFHCALQDGFGQTWWTGNMTISLQFVSLYDRQEIFVWSNCLLDLGTDFLVGNNGLCMRCVVFCGNTSFPWLVFFFGALLWGYMIHKHAGRWMWQGSASVVSYTTHHPHPKKAKRKQIIPTQNTCRFKSLGQAWSV